MDFDFLALDDVLYIHQNQIEYYGGEHGVRDVGLLESAIAQPMASFGGQYLHDGVFEMAAAYVFHIVQNHAFIDGNKRTGAAAALAFLDWNGIEVEPDNNGLVDAVLRVATGKYDKAEVAAFLRGMAR